MQSAKKPVCSVENSVARSIRRRGRGAVFVPADFLEFGSRQSVDVALHSLTRAGKIRRLARGLYDVPKKHPVLGTLLPPADAVARAIAGRDHTRIQPVGAYAANILGLTEQVPAKVMFLTDGPSRTVSIGPMTIQLRHTTPRNMMTAGRLSGLLIQAFRELGQQHISQERIAFLRKTIPSQKRRSILKDINLAPAWMRPLFRAIAEEA
jgi:hypothetical protein